MTFPSNVYLFFNFILVILSKKQVWTCIDVQYSCISVYHVCTVYLWRSLNICVIYGPGLFIAQKPKKQEHVLGFTAATAHTIHYLLSPGNVWNILGTFFSCHDFIVHDLNSAFINWSQTLRKQLQLVAYALCADVQACGYVKQMSFWILCPLWKSKHILIHPLKALVSKKVCSSKKNSLAPPQHRL